MIDNNAVHREAVGLFPLLLTLWGGVVCLHYRLTRARGALLCPVQKHKVPLGTHQNNRRTTVRTTKQTKIQSEQNMLNDEQEKYCGG
jgi:hypothetical protein